MSIFAIVCTAQNAKGIHMTPKNKMASRSPGLKYLGLSSRSQGRYIVARWSPREHGPGSPQRSWNVSRSSFLQRETTWCQIKMVSRSHGLQNTSRSSATGQVVACRSPKNMAWPPLSVLGTFHGIPCSGADLYREQTNNKPNAL